MPKASNDTLNEIHETLAKKLLEKIKSGEASASDYNVARQFLKDNGIESGGPNIDRTLSSLTEVVPFAAEETG